MSGVRRGLMVFKLLRKMPTRILALSKSNSCAAAAADDYDDASSPSEDLPDDVKEGHFVVYTNHGELKRFIVELGYLAHPGFLKLLEQAEEEYGSRPEGVLAIPCGPNELQRILERGKEKK